MSDYYPLLSRAVAGLDADTGESRRALYGRARDALCEQLRSHDPPLTHAEVTRERLSLEAAIRKFEAEAIRRTRRTPVARPAAAGTEFAAAPLGGAVCRPQVAAVRQSAEPGVGERERLVELALLAQVIDARDRRAGTSPGPAGGGDPAGMPARPAAAQGAHPVPAAEEVLTSLGAPWSSARAQSRSGPGSHAGSRAWSDPPQPYDLVTLVLGALYFVLGFAQLVAFFYGLQTWFGLGGVASIGIFMLLYLTGSVGSIPMAIVAFYGAWRGWQWPIWGAAVLAFPFVILSFGFLGIGGFYSFFGRRKASPIARAIERASQSPRWRERTRRWRAGLIRFGWNPPPPAGRPRRPRAGW